MASKIDWNRCWISVHGGVSVYVDFRNLIINYIFDHQFYLSCCKNCVCVYVVSFRGCNVTLFIIFKVLCVMYIFEFK